jgi:hypothetical protein
MNGLSRIQGFPAAEFLKTLFHNIRDPVQQGGTLIDLQVRTDPAFEGCCRGFSSPIDIRSRVTNSR